MALITLNNLSLSYGTKLLLNNINLSIEPRERICLIGRNGVGKSSLFKLLQGQVTADSGQIDSTSGLVITSLQQDIPRDLSGTIFDVVASGLGETALLLKKFETLTKKVYEEGQDDLLPSLQKVQEEIDLLNGWDVASRVNTVLSQMNLEGEQLVSTLSGGLIRRVLLAKALVLNPDILLLDEPTNHLDIETICWLETFLLNYEKTIVFITHDRSLLKKLATRIIEVDQGQLFSWACSYTEYLERKKVQLASEEKMQQLFDKRLAEEEVWIRQGIKARRTRNEGRVRRLEAMRQERGQREQRVGKVKFQTQSVDQGGKVVFEVENLHYAVGGKTIIENLSTKIVRGDKIGIIGANGCGKSTLLQLLLGELKPNAGTVKVGTNLVVSYFDQRREQLDESKPVVDNVYDGAEFIEINGKSVHVMSYLGDFLFTPLRARAITKTLSGGERHRLLLARLFTKPCNLLILDEPTNDLDAETLELLEERLLDYEGTLLLVSHDRDFLDHVVTSTLVFEKEGQVNEYIGGYEDYLRQKPLEKPRVKLAEKPEEKTKTVNPVTNSKLSYKEKLELEQLPKKISDLEDSIQTLQATLLDADFYKKSAEQAASIHKELDQLSQTLNQSYIKWEDLEKRNA